MKRIEDEIMVIIKFWFKINVYYFDVCYVSINSIFSLDQEFWGIYYRECFCNGIEKEYVFERVCYLRKCCSVVIFNLVCIQYFRSLCCFFLNIFYYMVLKLYFLLGIIFCIIGIDGSVQSYLIFCEFRYNEYVVFLFVVYRVFRSFLQMFILQGFLILLLYYFSIKRLLFGSCFLIYFLRNYSSFLSNCSVILLESVGIFRFFFL